MNIIYIAYSCDPYNGSEDKMGWNIPLESCKLGNKIIVITKEEQRENIEKYIELNKLENIEFYFIDIPQIAKKIFNGYLYSGRLKVWNKYAIKKVRDICKYKKIDIIHQITPIEFRAIGKYWDIPDTKFVVGPLGGGSYVPKSLYSYLGDKKFMEFFRLKINTFYKYKLKIFRDLKKCDYVLFSNEETRKFLDGNNESEIITEIGANFSEITNKISLVKSNKKIKFLVVGRLVCIKGHNLLFDVLEEMPKDLNYEINIVGEGEEYTNLTDRVNKNPYLSEHVNFLGKVDFKNMKLVYSDHDILIMPSIRENTGTVILEAISQGLPVIAMNKFGAKVIINEENGWLYDGKNKKDIIENFKNIMIECITSYDIINNKKIKALNSSRKYTWDKKVKYYNDIYVNIIKKDRYDKKDKKIYKY